MNDEKIIEMYKKGYSMNYISRVYYKYKNRNKKPIFVDGVKLYPVNVYNMTDCKLYVSQLIYSYILKKSF